MQKVQASNLIRGALYTTKNNKTPSRHGGHKFIYLAYAWV